MKYFVTLTLTIPDESKISDRRIVKKKLLEIFSDAETKIKFSKPTKKNILFEAKIEYNDLFFIYASIEELMIQDPIFYALRRDLKWGKLNMVILDKKIEFLNLISNFRTQFVMSRQERNISELYDSIIFTENLLKNSGIFEESKEKHGKLNVYPVKDSFDSIFNILGEIGIRIQNNTNGRKIPLKYIN